MIVSYVKIAEDLHSPGDLLKDRNQDPPELEDGRHQDPLVGRVGARDGGAERDAVESLPNLLAKDAALEPCKARGPSQQPMGY